MRESAATRLSGSPIGIAYAEEMLAEWTAECAADAPTLVVPWSDPGSHARFIDLRAEPYDIAEIPEAVHYPALGRALRALNAKRSPLLTAKCDAWALSAESRVEDLESLQLQLDLEPEEARVGFASYIDLLWRERTLFASAHRQQDRLDRLVRRAKKLAHREAALEFILRPAVVELEREDNPALNLNSFALEGFAVTFYVTALAADAETAAQRWAAALEDVVGLLRGRELEVPRGSATIDEADASASRGSRSA